MKDVNGKESLEEQIFAEVAVEMVRKAIEKDGCQGVKKLIEEMLKDCKAMEPVRHFNAVQKELEEAYRQKAAGQVFIDEFLDVPDTNVGDTISRKKAIEALREAFNPNIARFAKAKIAIEQLPPAEPQIIHCKDCRHRDEFGCCKYWAGLKMEIPTTATDDDDFCSHAERKEVTE